MSDVYHYGYNWMHDHYDDGDYLVASVPVILLLVMLCVFFIVFDCFATGATRAYRGGKLVGKIIIYPVAAPVSWAYHKIQST